MFAFRYSTSGGSPPCGPDSGRGTGRAWRRLVLLAAAVVVPLAVMTQATPALAATPQVTITCAATNNCTARGTGFTSYGTVKIQALAGTTVFSTSSLVATRQQQICITGPKPRCYTEPGGFFLATLPIDGNLACNATVAGTMQYTDVSSGATVSEPVTWTGPCQTATTTTLSIPPGADTNWSAVNPARVTAGSTAVTSGTITITVDGVSVCSYTAGATSGCTLGSLPAGMDQIQASYSGSTNPLYAPSSASDTVTVDQVQPSGQSGGPNWAGYAATGGTFTTASASWTVPKANCFLAVGTTSSTWVGIDGYNENTVEQIGTDSNCVAGIETYWAWYQMYPGGPVLIGALSPNYPVHAGDSMNASVRYTGTPGSYDLTITDNTAGWSYSTTQSVSGAIGGSAECVEERPAAAGLPLANFGSVTFSNCEAATGTGPSRPIWDYPNVAMNMTSSSGTPLASVSSLSDDGTQFTVNWLNGS